VPVHLQWPRVRRRLLRGGRFVLLLCLTIAPLLSLRDRGGFVRNFGDALAGLLGWAPAPRLWAGDSPWSRGSWMITLLATAASLVTLTLLERLSHARAEADAARRAAAAHPLRLLQSQLEPHMLFNTLANLRVLVALDPPRAQAMLDRLIAFLRSTLQASRAGTHPLADEFARLVDDDLGLMAVRMGARLRCTLTLPPQLAQTELPALLLQPLVENAIRHGLEPKVDGGQIEVSAARDGGRLHLSVHDSGVGWRDAAAGGHEGFGLAQVRERLAARYAGAARLDIGPAAGGGTLATLTLPLPP
jgi:LytS/YehU family sensor histidine kinase